MLSTRSLTLSPTHFDALHMLGVVADQTLRLTEAVTLESSEPSARNPTSPPRTVTTPWP